MTEVAGSVKQVGQGLTQTSYNYEPLSAIVDVITNTAGKSKVLLLQLWVLLICNAGQVVQAVVQKASSGSGSGGGASSTASASGTPMPVTLPVSSSTGTA